MGVTTKDTLENIKNLGSAASAKGMNTSDVSTAAGILESFRAAGRVDALSFRALAKMGINVYDAVAERLHISTDDVRNNLETPDGGDVADAIYGKMGEYFKDYRKGFEWDPNAEPEEGSKGMDDTYSGQLGRLQSYLDDQAAALGRGYEEVRKDGVENQADYFSKGGGAAMEAMNTIIGAGKGHAENLKEQYQREAMAAVLQGTCGTLYDEGQQAKLTEMRDRYLSLKSDYERAENSGDEEGMVSAAAHIETLQGEMGSFAENVFNASTGMQKVKDANLELVEALRENTNAVGRGAWSYRYDLGLEQSKGRAAAMTGGGGSFTTGTGQSVYVTPSGAQVTAPMGYGVNGWAYGASQAGKYAWGLPRVPYDNFPALLHAGERVLTASEARSADRGGEAKKLGGGCFCKSSVKLFTSQLQL